MFIKSLKIIGFNQIIREIKFHKGLNLIIDQTPDKGTATGNNVGKTTVLRLIDFCLGQDAETIYRDPENKRKDYILVRDFLKNNKIIISLELVDDLDNPQRIIEIERNFLQKTHAIYEINGSKIKQKDIESDLMDAIFPNINVEKPSFRQIISHNIRYDNLRLTNTLKTLGPYGKDEEYEALYLFMFGCQDNQAERRQQLLAEVMTEKRYKQRLEKEQTKNAYKTALDVVNADIERLNEKKNTLNINPDFDQDLKQLDDIKMDIHRLSSDISNLSIRKNIILDAKKDFSDQKFDVDLVQLKHIYQQAKAFIPNLQKTFNDMVAYHNQMLEQKIKFITEDLPLLDNKLKMANNELNALREKEFNLSKRITGYATFADLEDIISRINNLYNKKGKCESIIEQITEVETNLQKKNEELRNMDEGLFSESFKNKLEEQRRKFNVIFSSISEKLYDEQYAVNCDPVTNSKGQQHYKFSIMNVNFSSGKKQGEISSFDIAYTIFADKNNIPCLHFLLSDKKELMHDNQLVKIADVVNNTNIQFITSILEDKLPEEWKNDNYFIVKLSENDKLFRIEKYGDTSDNRLSTDI